MTRDTPAQPAQHMRHHESCDTFTTVTFCSHHPMLMWTVCSCLRYPTTPFLSVASHIQYIYITLHFAPTFFPFPCSVFFSFYIFVDNEGIAMREGATCSSGSEGSEAEEVVWCCLVISIDRWFGLVLFPS